MNNLVVNIVIVGFAAFAIHVNSVAMFFAAAGIAAASGLSRFAGIGTKLVMVVVGSLAGGLGGEIVRTVWLHANSTQPVGSRHFLDAIVMSAICAGLACVAVLCDRLVRRRIAAGG